MPRRRDDLDRLEEDLLQDPATREAYEKRRPAYDLALKLVAVREALGLPQRQLAARAGMTQPEIAQTSIGKASY